LWEIALGTLPTSSGVLPGYPMLLPARPRHAIRVAQAITRACLAHFVSSTDVIVANYLASDPVTQTVWRRDRRVAYPYQSPKTVATPTPMPIVSEPSGYQWAAEARRRGHHDRRDRWRGG